MPGRIVVTQYVSLDGVIEDPVGMESSGLGNWTGPFARGPEGDRFKHEELSAAESLILFPNDVGSKLQLAQCSQLGGGIVLLRYLTG